MAIFNSYVSLPEGTKPSVFFFCRGEGLILGERDEFNVFPLTIFVGRLRDSTFSTSMVEWIQITPQVAPQVAPQVQENRMKGIVCRIISGILCMLLVAIQSWMTS